MKKCYIHFVIVVVITGPVLLIVAVARVHHDCHDVIRDAYWEYLRPGCWQRMQSPLPANSGTAIEIGDSIVICCCCHWVQLVFVIATGAAQARPSARLTIVGS